MVFYIYYFWSQLPCEIILHLWAKLWERWCVLESDVQQSDGWREIVRNWNRNCVYSILSADERKNCTLRTKNIGELEDTSTKEDTFFCK